jgi:hypothetical protein
MWEKNITKGGKSSDIGQRVQMKQNDDRRQNQTKAIQIISAEVPSDSHLFSS